MFIIFWLLVGTLLAALYVWLVQQQKPAVRSALLGVGLAVAALIYLLFGIAYGNSTWLLIEAAGLVVFGIFAGLGIRRHPLWLAAGWGLHPAWDSILHLSGNGAQLVPAWYVLACLSFDVIVAAWVLRNNQALSSDVLTTRQPDQENLSAP